MNPTDEYRRRRDARRAEADRLFAHTDRLGQWRMGLLLAGIAAAIIGGVTHWFAPWWGLLALVPIVVLFVRAAHLTASKRWFDRLTRYYDLGLKRLGGDWPGTGNRGERFLDPAHLCAADLDLFGRGSLFERVCTARTAAGEDRLAGWFTQQASAEVVTARQQEVADLRSRLDLREALAAAGAEVASGADYKPLVEWAETVAPPQPDWRRTAVFALGGVNVVAAAAWLVVDGFGFVLLASAVVSFVVAWPMKRWAHAGVDPVEEATRDLGLLETVLARLEAEPFASDRLKELQQGLSADGVKASEQVRQLGRLADWYAARRNVFFLPFRLLLLWDTRMALRLDGWRRRAGPVLARWLDAVAEMEALSSLAAYAFENPADPFPTVTDGPPRFEGVQIGHPLLPADSCVRNDVSLGDRPGQTVRVLLVSGSNMSGKSTLLRAVGVNAVLALAGGPVRAASLTVSPVSLAATMRVQDSLADGKSRFFAEVVRVRAALDAAKAGPLLFLFDELFAGTNSADRVRGATGVIHTLLDAGAIGLVTTHDLAMTDVPADVRKRVMNVHFADRWDGGGLAFDYVMRPGVVAHTNGVALMRAVGLEV
jgi:hypothetical protein